MRVLHIYSGNLYGGIETFLVTLARYQHLCPTLEHSFALCFEGRLNRELNEAGAKVHDLDPVRVRNPLSVHRARRKLREILNDNNYDVVVCHSAWAQAIFGNEAKKAKLPLVFWLHNNANGKHWLERWASRTKPDLGICNSRFTASTLSRLYSTVRSEVFYCPVAPPEKSYSQDERLAVRDELQTPHDAVVITQVSRMEACKGHGLHLEALSRLREVPDWVCWMVGGAQRSQEETYQNELKAKAAQLGIAHRIRFLGERSDVLRVLYGSDIYCQPNIEPEGFGITFIESLYAGVPVVTTNIGGGSEIVDANYGILVAPADERDLANALQNLIANNDMRFSCGASGPARAAQLCGPKSQMQTLENLFLDCFGKNGR